MAGQWGSRLPTFCNFPKPTNQQPRPLFTETGKVHIGEKWAERCIPPSALVLFAAKSQRLRLCYNRWRGIVVLGKSWRRGIRICMNQQRNTLLTYQLTQVAFNTNQEIWIHVYASCKCNIFSVAFFYWFLANYYFYFVIPRHNDNQHLAPPKKAVTLKQYV